MRTVVKISENFEMVIPDTYEPSKFDNPALMRSPSEEIRMLVEQK